jgi:membrane protease subunit (stomatin/prohibitin family)
MREKIKKIDVKLNPNFIMWEVNLDNIVKETSLSVGEGCCAIYLVNGNLHSVSPAGNYIINTKEEYKNGASLRLIGVNSDKLYELMFGVGGVPYKDWELNVETLVGAHGTLKFRLINPWAIYAALGKINVTVEDIDDYIKPKIIEQARVQLAQLLQKYDYLSIQTQGEQLSKSLEEKLVDEFAPRGVEVQSFVLEEIFFNDEYKNKRKSVLDAENAKKQAKQDKREKARELKEDLEAMKAIKDISGGDDDVEVFINLLTSKYCPNCGTKNQSSAKFCSKCGAEL